jgi:hypothetical protein
MGPVVNGGDRKRVQSSTERCSSAGVAIFCSARLQCDPLAPQVFSRAIETAGGHILINMPPLTAADKAVFWPGPAVRANTTAPDALSGDFS